MLLSGLPTCPGTASSPSYPQQPWLRGSCLWRADDELYAIFTQGDAVIPAQRAPGRYTTCAGETLINAFTAGDSNYPKGTFPGGYASPLNNFFQRIWYGKVMAYTLHARTTRTACM